MKTCKGCGETKPTSEFTIYRASKDGLNSRCRICTRRKDKYKYDADIERGRQYQKRYGITLEEVLSMAEKQNYRCPICNKQCKFFAGNKGDAFVVDHCHETKIVRGLICATCNRGLGMFYDNPEVLKKAAEYLA